MNIPKLNSGLGNRTAGKIKKYFRKNNIEFETRQLREKLEKRSIIKDDNSFELCRKILEDTGYNKIDNVYRRKVVTRNKMMDSHGVAATYTQKMSNSIYTEDGRLMTREISKMKDDVCWSPELKMYVKYLPDDTNYVKTEYRKNNINYEKIAKKGSPTVYISEIPIDKSIDGLVKSQKITKNYSHLNKSSLKYTETINHEIERNGIEEVVTARKRAVDKDGITYLKTPHNNGNLIVKVVPENNKKGISASTTVFKTQEEIKGLFESLNNENKKEISNFLSK